MRNAALFGHLHGYFTGENAHRRLKSLPLLWARISKALSGLSIGEGLSAIFDRLRKPPERSSGLP